MILLQGMYPLPCKAQKLWYFYGQVETDETENGNGKRKRKAETESGNGKAEIRKWSSQLFQELPFVHAELCAMLGSLSIGN